MMLSEGIETSEARREYWNEIEMIAMEYRSDDPEDRDGIEDRDDWLIATINDHCWVIYTYQAELVMTLFTDHKEAWIDVLGENESVPVETKAAFAMIADVQNVATTNNS